MTQIGVQRIDDVLEIALDLTRNALHQLAALARLLLLPGTQRRLHSIVVIIMEGSEKP